MLISTVVRRLRYTLSDFTTSDEVLTGNLTLSSRIVAMENAGIGSPWTADEGSFSPEPSEDYIILTVLHCCSIAQQTLIRQIAKSAGLYAKLGPSSIERKHVDPSSPNDFISDYKRASDAWKLTKNIGAYRSIISPARLAFTPH